MTPVLTILLQIAASHAAAEPLSAPFEALRADVRLAGAALTHPAPLDDTPPPSFASLKIDPALDSTAPPDKPVDEIVRAFTQGSTDFKAERLNYKYRQHIVLQVLSPYGDAVKGQFEKTSVIHYGQRAGCRGGRCERVVYAPIPTMKDLQLTKEDEQDWTEIQPFALSTEEIAQYDVRYLGRKKLEEFENEEVYVFQVGPKVLVTGKRYFLGLAYVEKIGHQIVKTHGKAVPDIIDGRKYNLFPKFQTWRSQIDGKYWFPTTTIAEDTLHFPGNSVKMRMQIDWDDYKRFSSTNEVDSEIVPGRKP